MIRRHMHAPITTSYGGGFFSRSLPVLTFVCCPGRSAQPRGTVLRSSAESLGQQKPANDSRREFYAMNSQQIPLKITAVRFVRAAGIFFRTPMSARRPIWCLRGSPRFYSA